MMLDTGYIGKVLVAAGLVLVAAGLFFYLGGKTAWLGKLPGDIVIERKNYTIYIPIATGVLISIVLSLLFWMLGRK